jgi:hypothetical protein
MAPGLLVVFAAEIVVTTVVELDTRRWQVAT